MTWDRVERLIGADTAPQPVTDNPPEENDA
jgi:hypothetical protein